MFNQDVIRDLEKIAKDKPTPRNTEPTFARCILLLSQNNQQPAESNKEEIEKLKELSEKVLNLETAFNESTKEFTELIRGINIKLNNLPSQNQQKNEKKGKSK